MNRLELKSLILQKLDAHSEDIRRQWASPSGTRTRHFVLDDLLPEQVARDIFAAFPRDGDGFFNRESFREKKRTSANLSHYAPILGEITYAIQDREVVDKTAGLVGLTELEPDATLYAGGLSMMFRGDFLNPHIDNSHDGNRQRYRRLNLLYYVTPDWVLENGGNFELWNDDVKVPKTIVARFNRLVVMETNKLSWHSVSPVVSETPRCVVSNYFFSQRSPDESEYFHVTSFTGRPEEGVKRGLGVVDNYVRNTISKAFKIGRGKDLIRKD
jgi:Rps23 Pro-64 3,4-dihydroxylase Tpa1-like proline 4-hydroxylase